MLLAGVEFCSSAHSVLSDWQLFDKACLFDLFSLFLFIFEYFSFCFGACSQDEAAEPARAHTQAVSMKHPEADDLSHTENNSKASSSSLQFFIQLVSVKLCAFRR